mmetsp:Transcript_17758/g.25069  ORF Transcript_17758/g.25069 Transcript_17758/m.25069 type:complete len:734 (-) Transcript_17758:367-2568(-)|eukprot:CAMPEP_0184866528 /NCGR_PEP_ID=MMETSP0580-20130426/22764_1 /TAXON_ID=1118495 /ORGANISM="Dactyliosolen fragilissimus" /LENGTH=733 /DNA_ID=CAMNT_0027366263 /DNA_START=299 /DNA_END=2500 /DNA_ORIENTATION=-
MSAYQSSKNNTFSFYQPSSSPSPSQSQSQSQPQSQTSGEAQNTGGTMASTLTLPTNPPPSQMGMDHHMNSAENNMDAKSHLSSRSDARSNKNSAVMARAREYNRIIDEKRTVKDRVRKTGQCIFPSAPGDTNNNNNNERNQKSVSPSQQSHASSSMHRAELAARDAISGSGNSRSTSRSSPSPIHPSGSSGSVSRSPSPPNHVDSNSQSNPRSQKHASSKNSNRGQTPMPAAAENNPIVTPELLVDALSGHEDGLLAIAERLMSHYDSGYDAMGEAIIDAFADVQKLFQHVVEAAHMEGAAHEANRREEEISKLKLIIEENGGDPNVSLENHSSNEINNNNGKTPTNNKDNNNNGQQDTSTPMRHEEFIDQDVRDELRKAIRDGKVLTEKNEHSQCYNLYEKACHSASALLPVDSDHRGRLQLSIARAESMTPERACAILKYVMDDVLRSGLNANSKVVMPDPSQRGDCVLERPTRKSRLKDPDPYSSASKSTWGGGNNSSGPGSPADGMGGAGSPTDGNVLQSADEALASLVEEMKEVLGAPVYDCSPLQDVAGRFWIALADAQRDGTRNEERLEQKLATLKAEFLLAREEWEEKYNSAVANCQTYKKKLKSARENQMLESARAGMKHSVKNASSREREDYFDGDDSPGGNIKSVASFGSIAYHARNIVGSFSCTGTENSQERSHRGGHRRMASDLSEPPSIISSNKTTQSSVSNNNFRSPGGGRYRRRNDL